METATISAASELDQTESESVNDEEDEEKETDVENGTGRKRWYKEGGGGV